ncbi:DNA recombination protein RmuC [Candidatus Phycosocius spiralis]|uniref:DNA recombination protein RmuC homolog n=1 Tax=Candidatus Phycosocius spiralis TaxID=2815099 RepID=A0ABQ4PXP0_9PROT|nr:DNA recombination protein RmuC [Candidatus Phycosocius spiralis]GIU67685.1 DNA recombination protein RmuC [Candidatus Phycosocius spiralis]
MSSETTTLIALIGLYALVALIALYFALTRSNRPLNLMVRRIDDLNVRVLDHGQVLQQGISSLRDEASRQNVLAREEMANRLAGISQELHRLIDLMATNQRERLDHFGLSLAEHRVATGDDSRALREEVNKAIALLSTSLMEGMTAHGRLQIEGLSQAQTQIKELMEANDRAALALRQTVEGRLDVLRQENEAKLEQMRVTVDEKLQGTLEQRLGASFSQVNEHLERVFKSVGEMQTIATGVGDLKRVLTNVKARGTWGEASLGMLLEQAMSQDQYAHQVEVKPSSNQRVEYAIRLPNDGDSPVWLPIDAKLPIEDYERLIDASERADGAAVEAAQKGLEKAIRVAAKDISDKYIAAPYTTDFAIMFLPTEGLFAEVVRRPGLVDLLQREHKVLVSGPTTLMATLTSLRMGFRTLAIQQRSSEVWQVLSTVKQEFEKFGGVLKKVEDKLDQAKNVVLEARTRENVLGRRLRAVESLPGSSRQDALPSIDPSDLLGKDDLDDRS